MKKYLCAAVVVTLATTIAYGSSISVPFFLDWEQPEIGVRFRGFVGVKNNTNEDIVISVFYRDGEGQNRTPGAPPLGVTGTTITTSAGTFGPGDYNSHPTNTHILPANASIAWRPATSAIPRPSENPTENTVSGVSPGIDVPTMVGSRIYTGDLTAPTPGQGEILPWSGSVEIRWMTVTSDRDIQGRYLETELNANARAAYLLPPGIGVD